MDQKLLYKYFKGTATMDEEKQILDWVDESPANRNAFQKERMLYDIALFTDEKKLKKEQKTVRILPVLRWSARIAAVVAVALSCGFLFRDYQYNKVAQMQTVAVPAGQRAQITLADGTRVWLNAKSTLTYASNFGRTDRNILLEGEAFFEVAKNKDIPFYVNTEKNKVRVVGTSFNVCAYKDSKEFETTLVEGVVDIYAVGKEKPIARLQKNEFFADYDGKLKKTVLPSYAYLRWKEGLYCFDDSELSHILNRLELYYNVKITVKNKKLLSHRYTAKFKEQDGIEHILKVIQKDQNFKYYINEEKDQITIE